MATSEFPGSSEEANKLMEAINHNCACPPRAFGMVLKPEEICPPHKMLLEKGVINQLLFGKSRRSQMIRQEFGPQMPKR